MMRWFLSLLVLCTNCAFCFATDFDVVVVGTSPFSMLEALYRYHAGNRVLIVERSGECGGAWKSINICGIPNVDLGCHLIGRDPELLDFFKDYLGCKMVSMDNPHVFFDSDVCQNGFYPSRGCHEMIENLEKLVLSTAIDLRLNTSIESVWIDPETAIATVKTTAGEFTTPKIIITPATGLKIENHSYCAFTAQNQKKTRYSHLYLLIDDPTPQRFSYHDAIADTMSRMMNLTHFVGLEGTGKQLIVIQIHCKPTTELAETYLDNLKAKNLIHSEAKIIESDSFIYEQASCYYPLLQQVKYAYKVLEMLDTYSLQCMANYIPKWKQRLPLYKQVITETEHN